MSKTNKLLKNLVFGTPDDDSLSANNGNDIIFGFGGDGNDELYGENGNDGIAGDDGNDFLSGGDGRDFLVGGAGNDRAVGGAGPDTFVIRHGTGKETIADLDQDDRIDLRDFNFASQQAARTAFQQQGHDAVLN